MDADAAELRVLGCLVEKQRTTPDQYPLSLNALRLACNQATNRDPVVSYDEPEIRSALERLTRRGWARLASGAGSRVAKYRHLLDDALKLTGSEISLLTVLMLRGPQTVGELKGRTERLYPFPALGDVEAALERLSERELVVRLERKPGQKEERWQQRLGETAEPAATPDGRTQERVQLIAPYLLYEDVAGALRWLTDTFGFREVLRFTGPDGSITHAELSFGGESVFLGDPGPEYRSPARLGARTAQVHVYVDDVEAHHARAVAAGAEIRQELADMPYGDRRYDAIDPEGQLWSFATRLREVAPREWGAVSAGDA
jgi:uncharacterized protein YceH (UPF0502 family)/uncharacterized glyoxalase superfamily protein PhnB